MASKRQKKIYLRLAFGREGGGSSGSCVETAEKSTCGSRLDAREMEKRRWCCRVFGCCRGFALPFRSGGEVSGLSGDGRIDGENEPRQTSWLVFYDALNGPPTSWVPHRVYPSPTPPSIDQEPPISL